MSAGLDNACRVYYSVNWLAGGCCVILGAISDKYTEKYDSLGLCQSGEFATADTVGRYNRFERGSIYWHLNTHAHEVHGFIHAKWAQKGYERSLVGFPVTDEVALPNGLGSFNHFEFGSIYWKNGLGVAAVFGALGYERSSLGYPVRDEYAVTGGRESEFERGYITLNTSTGTLTVRMK
ncbi:LGFP repeat-containing protein [Archangium lipolyticum]|uniref:LGFP repeat-containing protein n=1 Tax=Archangium lipolyticum TaxID=2970465 RepID=UPI00214A4770|nr:hypothetical protein [Archangium lipolyticum]